MRDEMALIDEFCGFNDGTYLLTSFLFH